MLVFIFQRCYSFTFSLSGIDSSIPWGNLKIVFSGIYEIVNKSNFWETSNLFYFYFLVESKSTIMFHLPEFIILLAWFNQKLIFNYIYPDFGNYFKIELFSGRFLLIRSYKIHFPSAVFSDAVGTFVSASNFCFVLFCFFPWATLFINLNVRMEIKQTCVLISTRKIPLRTTITAAQLAYTVGLP